MRYTLLEMTQRILEAMEADEVNSYSDTAESLAVANIIRESYWFLSGEMDLPANHTFYQLVASGDSTKPVLMSLPSDAIDLDYIKYKDLDDNSNSEWDEVLFKTLPEFLDSTLTLKESDSNVSTMTVSLDGASFEFKFYTDRKPEFYTTISDGSQYFIFNAYDSSVETTLQASKTLCFGKKLPTFTMDDDFTPQLDPQQFQLLLNEAKSQAFIELKQQDNAHARRRAAKSHKTVQRTKNNVPSYRPGTKRAPNFGRNGPR